MSLSSKANQFFKPETLTTYLSESTFSSAIDYISNGINIAIIIVIGALPKVTDLLTDTAGKKGVNILHPLMWVISKN